MPVILEKAQWVQNDETFPCVCCSAVMAMKKTHWLCYNQNKNWLILEEEPDLSLPHEAEVCRGAGCSDPLHTPAILNLLHGQMQGLGWGDIALLWEQEEMSLLSAEELAELERRRAEERARRAEEEALEEAARICAAKARDQRACASLKSNKGKEVPLPCKWLQSCEGTKPARPTTLHVSSECWSHEQTNPKTGKLETPHVCWHRHPGQSGWHKEWETDRLWKPAPVGNVFQLSARSPAPSAGNPRAGGGKKTADNTAW